jgi:hypothetical protein
MVIAKHPLIRRVYYWLFGIGSLIAGWSISYSSFVDYRKEHRALTYPLIFIGFLLPFIIVGGERMRYILGARKVKCVRCQACSHECDLKAIYKTGTCPSCGSKKVRGVRFDGSTI